MADRGHITDVEEDYIAFLVWETGGMYMIGQKSIAAHETVHIDVKELRDQQIPDERGRTIPLYISSGQLQWTLQRKDSLPDDDVRANLSVIGRSEQVDVQNGIVNNYSCQNCCPGNHVGGFITPSSLEIEYGESAQFRSVEVQETCYGFPYEFYINSNWTSSNSGMGSITGGLITPQSAGVSTIGASWSSHFSISNPPCPPEPPYFAFGMLNASCSDERHSGPSDEIALNYEPANYEPDLNYEPAVERTSTASIMPMLIPGCGECMNYGFTAIPAPATLTVKPKVTINVPATATDGDTVTFSATTQGGTPTSYQWSFTAPTGSGNNPQVTFSSPNSSSTTAKAHWFAKPDTDCPPTTPSPSNPYYNSKYEINVKVTFDEGVEITKDDDFTVNAYWFLGGAVGMPRIRGIPQIEQVSFGTWGVVGPGTLMREPQTTPTMYVPNTSQFYSKLLTHENVHIQQWQPGQLLGGYVLVEEFMDRIDEITETSRARLIQRLGNELDTYYTLERNEIIASGGRDQAEIEAYDVSDPLNPMYAYQRCGRTVFP